VIQVLRRRKTRAQFVESAQCGGVALEFEQGGRSRAMLQQVPSAALTRVSESSCAKFSADGAIPADLRISESAGVEPAVPSATAKALGLTIPPQLLLRADEVIR
jgi:hypothetical protein